MIADASPRKRLTSLLRLVALSVWAFCHSWSALADPNAQNRDLHRAVELATEVLRISDPNAVAVASQDGASCGLLGSGRSEKILDTCCVCFAENRTTRKETRLFTNVCKDWLRADSGRCPKNARFIIPMTTQTSEQAEFDGLPIACSKVRVMGSFHGEPLDYALPFSLAKTLAQQLHSKEVCYDGKSCLVFNNLEFLNHCAQDIRSSECEFTISGNQNVYGMMHARSGLLGRTLVDLPSTSSKTTVRIPRRGSITLTHDQCSPTGSFCMWLHPALATGATNNANSKTCLHRGKPVQQTCCSYDDEYHWSAPGKGCR